MSKSKYIDRICTVIVALALVITLFFLGAGPYLLKSTAADPPYTKKLFDTNRIHTLDIAVKDKDWQNMLDNAMDKQYIPCNVVIDGENIKNVAIRPKGASSLLAVSMSDSDRVSFKIEFDHYEPSQTYYGLDKLVLNNLIQDNTYLMDYLAYNMMRSAGINSPLASFIWITVNGKDWGLYLAVEGIEDAFAQRNYGNEPGNIYKPDNQNILFGENGNEPVPQDHPADQAETMDVNSEKVADRMIDEDTGGMQDPGISGDDVSLLYKGEDPDNYPNIFNHAVLGEADRSDKQRLIQSLKQLNEQKNLSEVLDIDEILRYFAVHNFLINGDSYTGILVHNYYLREYKGKLSMIPWDYNLSFGGMSMSYAQVGNEATSYINAPVDEPVSGGNAAMQSRPMISWIFSNEQYKEAYHKTLSNFITQYFESGRFEELLEKTVNLISPYVKKDPTAFTTYEEFLKGTQTLREFCNLRVQSIRGQLNGTIPSTIEGQEKNAASLIDGSSIHLTDMTKEGDIGTSESFSDNSPKTDSTVDGIQKPTGEEVNEAGDDIVMMLPDNGSDTGTDSGSSDQQILEESGEIGGPMQDSQTQSPSANRNEQQSNEPIQLLLLIGSAVLLLGGLLTAKFYT